MTTVSTTLELPDAAQRNALHRLLSRALKWLVLVSVLVPFPIYEATHLQSLSNATSWLHLQVGNWIISHHTVPHFGILSQSSDSPWSDPNWGLQVVLAAASHLLGMRAIPVVVMVLQLLFAVALFILAGGRRGNFWVAIVVSLWAQIASNNSLPPVLCSAILFSLEIFLLLRNRTAGQLKLLYWIPLLILLWVNLDWRFIFGIAIFWLFCLANVSEHFLKNRSPSISREEYTLLSIVASLIYVASLASPTLTHSYRVALQNLLGPSLFAKSLVTDLQAFREPQHYLLMALAMFAFLLLGRRHLRDFFQVSLLVFGISLGFALGSEAWIIAVASVGVIGEFFTRADNRSQPFEQLSATVFRSAVAIAGITVLVAMFRIPSRPDTLLKVMAYTLPVQACDFVRENHLPGPIYNELEWGDFLVWYLPEYPVAIDDRYELYGDRRTRSYYQVTRSQANPSSDPALTVANTILLSTRDGVIWSLDAFPNREEILHLSFPGFREVYRDDLAVVLSRTAVR